MLSRVIAAALTLVPLASAAVAEAANPCNCKPGGVSFLSGEQTDKLLNDRKDPASSMPVPYLSRSVSSLQATFTVLNATELVEIHPTLAEQIFVVDGEGTLRLEELSWAISRFHPQKDEARLSRAASLTRSRRILWWIFPPVCYVGSPCRPEGILLVLQRGEVIGLAENPPRPLYGPLLDRFAGKSALPPQLPPNRSERPATQPYRASIKSSENPIKSSALGAAATSWTAIARF